MKRYILTGTPGSGKTTIIESLTKHGYSTITESATDIIEEDQKNGILEPWRHADFIDKIVSLQKKRQQDISCKEDSIQFYDRSPICTYALALYLGFSPSALLLEEIERLQKNHIYEKQVFFLENLGFMVNTNARKISFEEALKFEAIHLDTYQRFGYNILMVPKLPVEERLEFILSGIVTK